MNTFTIYEPVEPPHAYEESHPVHCSCNRVESLGMIEKFKTPTIIVTLPVYDRSRLIGSGAFRIDCDAVLDSDRAVS